MILEQKTFNRGGGYDRYPLTQTDCDFCPNGCGNLWNECEKLFREHALTLLPLSFRNNISHTNHSGKSQSLINRNHFTHFTHLTHFKKAAFTLAEVLVTLAVIGIVAVMTIPNMVSNYQKKAWDTADTVFQRKLTEALKVMNVQGTLAGYSSTEDFVTELSKHLKITKTCTNSNLTACFSNTVMWGKDEDSELTEVDISKLKTAKDFGQEDWDTNIMGFQLASGVTGLMAYNPKCKQDEYSNQITGGDCLAVLYDVQGYSKPNTSSKDLRHQNVLALGSTKTCDVEFDNHCWTISAAGTALSHDDCETLKDDLGIKECFDGDDYWGGAVKKCGGTKNLPKSGQLAQLATQIYGESGTGADNRIDKEVEDQELWGTFKAKSSELDFFAIWSNEENADSFAYGRIFESTSSYYTDYISRESYQVLAVCLND